MARFGNITLRIRPLRLAFLVDANDGKHARKAIQLASTVWGGGYCPIIPIYKRISKIWSEGASKSPNAESVVLGYLDAFDPDILVQFASELPPYLNAVGLEVVKPEKIWEKIRTDEPCYISPQFGIGIFEILHDLFEKAFKYKAKYPVEVVIPEIPQVHPLFWSSVFGEISGDLMSLLKKHYFEPLEIKETTFEPGKIADLFKNSVLFPRRWTQHALKQSRSSGLRARDYGFFMDAENVDDVIDFWNLRATGRNVLPIPKQYLKTSGITELAKSFFKSRRVPWSHNRSVCDFATIVRSRNSTMEELQSFATVLTIEKSPGDPSDSPFFSLQRWYPRIWDEWARDKDGISPDDFFGDENVIEIHGVDEKDVSFTPLLPSFAEKGVYHGEPRCVNEISFRMYGSSEYLAGVFPKSTGKNFIRAISSLTSFRDYWRVGRNGLLKFVKDQFVESWTIPESQKVVFAWLKDQGWEAELSAPGLLAKQMFRQLDGHAAALMNEKLLALLEHMSGGRVSRDGRPVAENRIMQERDLPIGEIRTRLRDSNGHDICDYLIEKGVFHVGLRLQCPNCGRHSWFQSSRLDDNLICPRCLNPFRAIGNIEKGTWCYKTTGPFSVPNYADGAYATLLALNFFNEHKLMGTRSTPVLNFTAKSGTREPLEADFACFWADRAFDAKSEGLVFGECKTYGQFGKKDFERMRYLAKCFPGAILAFCTLKKQLTGVEARAIGRIARAGRKYWRHDHPINPVLVLTGNELLSFDAPPYCWKDAETQKRFERIHGLLSICNATQQLYLNLPRWEDEWVKRRDPRRGKSQLKSTEPAGKAAEVQT